MQRWFFITNGRFLLRLNLLVWMAQFKWSTVEIVVFLASSVLGNVSFNTPSWYCAFVFFFTTAGESVKLREKLTEQVHLNNLLLYVAVHCTFNSTLRCINSPSCPSSPQLITSSFCKTSCYSIKNCFQTPVLSISLELKQEGIIYRSYKSSSYF